MHYYTYIQHTRKHTYMHTQTYVVRHTCTFARSWISHTHSVPPDERFTTQIEPQPEEGTGGGPQAPPPTPTCSPLLSPQQLVCILECPPVQTHLPLSPPFHSFPLFPSLNCCPSPFHGYDRLPALLKCKSLQAPTHNSTLGGGTQLCQRPHPSIPATATHLHPVGKCPQARCCCGSWEWPAQWWAARCW